MIRVQVQVWRRNAPSDGTGGAHVASSEHITLPATPRVGDYITLVEGGPEHMVSVVEWTPWSEVHDVVVATGPDAVS